MRARALSALSAVLLVAGIVGCRGWTSDKPPVHLNPNMDKQEKLKAYRESDFFADGKAMRTPPAGTVGRTLSGNQSRDLALLRTDEHYFEGTVNGATATSLPPSLKIDETFLQRGRERYDIYCAPCHARHGNGKGTVAARYPIPVPTFHDDARRALSVPHIYRVITLGNPLPERRAGSDAPLNMPSYAKQIPHDDRWAIALYVRALQSARAGRPIPVEGLAAAEPKGPAPDAPAESAPAEGEAAPPTGAAPAEAAPAAPQPEPAPAPRGAPKTETPPEGGEGNQP